MSEQLDLLKTPAVCSEPPRVSTKGLRVIQVRCDGGCRPNPGEKYGSYEIVKVREKVVIARATRFALGIGTSNEAEFESLLMALERLNKWVAEFQFDPRAWHIRVITDSTVVRGHLLNTYKAEKENPHNLGKVVAARRRNVMIEFGNRCKKMLRTFGGFEVNWQDRQNNVDAFGH
jgi:ribonuclease HI